MFGCVPHFAEPPYPSSNLRFVIPAYILRSVIPAQAGIQRVLEGKSRQSRPLRNYCHSDESRNDGSWRERRDADAIQPPLLTQKGRFLALVPRVGFEPTRRLTGRGV